MKLYLKISMYFWGWCVCVCVCVCVCMCVCENIIYGSLHGCNSKIHGVETSKNIHAFPLSAAVEPGQKA